MGTSPRLLLLALRPYPSSAPPVTRSSSPVQKVASEARKTAAAATSAGWPMRPRGWAKVPSRMVALGSEVEAASSSHSGVQMFPGEMLGGHVGKGLGLADGPDQAGDVDDVPSALPQVGEGKLDQGVCPQQVHLQKLTEALGRGLLGQLCRWV